MKALLIGLTLLAVVGLVLGWAWLVHRLARVVERADRKRDRDGG